MQQDMREFVTALAVGAALGAAVALSLRPAPISPKERVLREVRRRRRRIQGDLLRAKRGLSESAAGSADIGRAVGEAGRDLVDEVRSEVLGMVAGAWERFALSLANQLHDAAGRGAPDRSSRRA